MRLQLISDLHLEFYKGNRGVFRIGDRLLEESKDIDALVLAGDVGYLSVVSVLHEFFEYLTRRAYEKIFFVPGNHDFYGSSTDETDLILAGIPRAFPKVEVLSSGRVVEFKGHRFLGDTMWFPDGDKNAHYSKGMNDFWEIKKFVPWVYQQNTAFKEFLQQDLKPGDIVVTHHLPTNLSTHPKYAGHSLNRFFISDMTPLIKERKPALWMHGHTHEKFDYRLADTRVVCNPVGYPGEGKPFNAKCFIDL